MWDSSITTVYGEECGTPADDGVRVKKKQKLLLWVVGDLMSDLSG